MQEYLSHSDGTIRRLGMLVAEILSERTIPDDGSASTSTRKGKAKGKGKEKDDEVEELERMLQSLGDGDEAPSKATQFSSGKQRRRLDFGREIWDGFGQGKEECRRLRALVCGGIDETGREGEGSEGMEEDWLLGWNAEGSQPQLVEPKAQEEEDAQPRGRSPSPTKRRPPSKAEPDSDDESLSGYSSSAHSSRSPSPTPSYLEEVAKDPMSNTNTREKVQRPVYIIQLIELLRAREEPDKLEVGLKWGESLVRRKRHFGKELGESGPDVTYMLVS
jgi:telomere length regulation protein